MFRLAFWVVLLVFLIPVKNDAKDLSKETNLTADTITLAQGLYKDLSGLCDRNSDTCEAAGQIKSMFERKLKAGASYVISYIEEHERDSLVTGTTDLN